MHIMTASATTPEEVPVALAHAIAEPLEEDSDNDSLEELVLVPTVRLSLLNRDTTSRGTPLAEAEDYSDPEFDDAIEALITSGPLAQAEEVTVAASAAEEVDQADDSYAPQRTQHNGHYATARAEYVSASFFKDQDPKASLGIKLGKSAKDSSLRILSIAPNSPASKSPLRKGDKLVSINSRACAQMTTKSVYDALSMPGMITLVVHNQGGAPDVVESMITKLYRDQMIGMGIQKKGDGSLCIGNIKASLGAAQTLLNPQDRLLSINDTNLYDQPRVTANDARITIAQAEDVVVIRAITSRETGVVVAEEEEEEKKEPQERVIPKWLQSTLTLQRKPNRRFLQQQQQQQAQQQEPECSDTNAEQQRLRSSSLDWLTQASSDLLQMAH